MSWVHTLAYATSDVRASECAGAGVRWRVRAIGQQPKSGGNPTDLTNWLAAAILLLLLIRPPPTAQRASERVRR